MVHVQTDSEEYAIRRRGHFHLVVAESETVTVALYELAQSARRGCQSDIWSSEA